MRWSLLFCAVLIGPSAGAQEPRSRAVRLFPEPLEAGRPLGQPLAVIDARRRPDALVQAGPVTLAGRSWRFGLAADADFKRFYLAVTGRRGTRFHAIVRLRDLIGDGQDFVFEPRIAFRARIKPSLADPLHASQIELSPLPGTPGGSSRWKAAELLDMLEKQAVYFRQDGQDFFLAWAGDVDPVSLQRAGTRTLVIFAQRRFRSRLWRLPERDLQVGRPARVRLGRRTVILLLRADGLLVVYSGG